MEPTARKNDCFELHRQRDHKFAVEHRCGQASPSVVRAVPAAQITAVKGSNFGMSNSGKTQIRRNGKQCNMPNSKEMSCAVINLYKKSYSIVTPDKSPCLLNHY